MANFLWKESTDLRGIKVVGDDEMIKRIQGNQLAIVTATSLMHLIQ